MKKISNIALFIAGVFAYVGTTAILFQNFEGIQDLSLFEWLFLTFYGLAAQRVYKRNRKLGKGFWSTGLRVINSAGICSIIFLAIALAGWLSPDKSTAQYSSEIVNELAVQVIWFGALLLAVFFAAPHIPNVVQPTDAPSTKPIVS